MRLLVVIAALAAGGAPSAAQPPRPAYEEELVKVYRRPLTPQELAAIRAPMSDAKRYELYREMWRRGDAERPPPSRQPGEFSPREAYEFFHGAPAWGWALGGAALVYLCRPRRKRPE